MASNKKQRKIDAYLDGMRRHFKEMRAPSPDDPWPELPSDPIREQMVNLVHEGILNYQVKHVIDDLIENVSVDRLLPFPTFRFPVTEYDIDVILDRVLSDSNVIIRKNDPIFLRYFTVKVKGWFGCGVCYHRWISYNTSVKVDLLEKEVKMYQQMCKGGNASCYTWTEPYLRKEEFEIIAKTVIKYYKQRRKAGGIVPWYEFENSGLDKRMATRCHNERFCERCLELGEPCWLHLVPIIKPMPLAASPDFVLASLSASLKALHAIVKMDKGDSGKDTINILPSKESSSVKNWRQKSEAIVISFLKNCYDLKVPVQPDIIPKLQGVMDVAKSNPSVYLEKQTMLQIVAATKQDVDKLLRKIKQIESAVAEESRNKTSKPCIIIA